LQRRISGERDVDRYVMRGNIVYQLHLMDWHENNMGVKVCVVEDDAL